MQETCWTAVRTVGRPTSAHRDLHQLQSSTAWTHLLQAHRPAQFSTHIFIKAITWCYTCLISACSSLLFHLSSPNFGGHLQTGLQKTNILWMVFFRWFPSGVASATQLCPSPPPSLHPPSLLFPITSPYGSLCLLSWSQLWTSLLLPVFSASRHLLHALGLHWLSQIFSPLGNDVSHFISQAALSTAHSPHGVCLSLLLAFSISSSPAERLLPSAALIHFRSFLPVTPATADHMGQVTRGVLELSVSV